MINAGDLRLLANNSRNELTKKRKRILKKIERKMIAAAKKGIESIYYTFDLENYSFLKEYLENLGYFVTMPASFYAEWAGCNAIISWYSFERKDYGEPPTGNMPIKSKEVKLVPCSKEAEMVVSKYWDKNARPKFRSN